MPIECCQFVTLCLIVALGACDITEHVVTVAPSDTNSTSQQHYTLLNYLAFEGSIFNRSNTTIEFLAGTHEVNGRKELVVEGVSNVVWTGKAVSTERVVIHCKQDFVFAFVNVQNLTLSNLELRYCGYHKTQTLLPPQQCRGSFGRFKVRNFRTDPIFCYLSETELRSSILVLGAAFVNLINVEVQGGKGYGLLTIDTKGKLLIDGCRFLKNGNNNIKSHMNNTITGGNALIIFIDTAQSFSHIGYTYLAIKNSLIQNGLDNSLGETFTYDRELHSNGLGLVMEQTTPVEILIENVTFSENIGNLKYPSIVIAQYSSRLTVTITDSTFTKDGTLKIVHSMKILSSYLKFENCMFIGGMGTGIEVSLFTSLNSHVSSFFHERVDRITVMITLEHCLFKNHKSLKDASMLKVDHSSLHCPLFRVEVMNSVFAHNAIRFLQHIFGTNTTPNCPSVVVTNCVVQNNVLQENNYLMLLESRKESGQHTFVSDTHHMSMYFSNVTFKDNIVNVSKPSMIGIFKLSVSFADCRFVNSAGTALEVISSVVSLSGINQFINNTGIEGGAIALKESRLHLSHNTTLILKGNKADYGGGIFATPGDELLVEGKNYPPCSLSYSTYNISDLNISVHLSKNSAVYAGDSALFDVVLEKCYVLSSPSTITLIITSLLNMITIVPTLQTFYSLPASLKLCTKRTIERIYTFPGAAFNVSIKAVPRIAGTQVYTEAVLEARLCATGDSVCGFDYKSDLHSGVNTHRITGACNNLTFSIDSQQKQVLLEIGIGQTINEQDTLINDYLKKSKIHKLITVDLLSCPIGYKLSNQGIGKPYCECIQYLLSHGIKCDINQGGTILIPRQTWIGFHPLHPNNVTVHRSCPFCLPNDQHVSLSEPDQQCVNSHAGVLCGACQTNLSLVIGSSKCKKCSSLYLLLIIPFALIGVALVALLLKCNLTVSNGHINGIIFYANLVSATNKGLLFPRHDVCNFVNLHSVVEPRSRN